MVKYILRRAGIALVIVLASTALSFFLVVVSGDPLEDLAQLRGPEKASKTALRTQVMHLDKPVIVRYGYWLAEVGRCLAKPFTGAECTLGSDRQGRAVLPQLTQAMGSTVRLVLAATIIAMFLGILVGLVTALRQYSVFDYATTFVAFLCYSMPSFWIATMLKQYAAIDFNNWLTNPTIGWGVLLAIALAGGVIWMLIVGGDRKLRWMVFGVATVATGLPLLLLVRLGWFSAPRLGLIGVILSAIVMAWLWSTLLGGSGKRAWPVRKVCAVAAGLGVAAYLVLNYVVGTFWDHANEGIILLLAAVAALAGVAAGHFLGGVQKSQAMKAGALTTVTTGVFIVLDRLLMAYPQLYSQTRGHPIATTGSQTPNLPDDFWFVSLDRIAHLVLPTAAIALISFAGYTRYTRATTLDVLNQDFIRTARSKGLLPRTVVVRHVFRNVMIPISTLIALDFAGVMAGAVVTETIFGWSGMGKLFSTSLTNVDPNPLMAYMLVTATLIVVMNLVADIAYAFLDPRIRIK